MSESGIAAAAEMKSTASALIGETLNCVSNTCPMTDPCGANGCLALARLKELQPFGRQWTLAKAAVLPERTRLFTMARGETTRRLSWDGTVLKADTLLLRKFELGFPNCTFEADGVREKLEVLEVVTYAEGRWRKGYVRRSVLEGAEPPPVPSWQRRFFQGFSSLLSRARA